MSVVNQMLKDLQRREYRPPQGAVRLVLGAAANDARGPGRDPRPLLIVVMLATSLGFALATDWQFLSRDGAAAPRLAAHDQEYATEAASPARAPTRAATLPPGESTPAAPASLETVPAKAMTDTPAPEPRPAAATGTPAAPHPEVALLGRIRSGWQPGRTRFVFKFQQWPPQIHLDDSNRDRVSISFASTTMRAAPPSRPAGDRQLGKIRVAAEAPDLGFEFSASDGLGIRARYHRVSRDGEWPHWVVLDLHWQSRPAVDQEAQVTAARVATPEPIGPIEPPAPAGQASRLEKRSPAPTPQQLAEQALAGAHAALAEGRTDAARELAQRALDLAPASVAAAELHAGLLLRDGDLARAEGLLRAGLERHPAHPGMGLLLARVLIEQSREDQALELLNRLSGGAADPELLAMRAATRQRLQQHHAAVADYMAALHQVRGQGLWWLGLAISLEALEHRGDALAAYTESLDSGMLAGEVRSYAEARIRALQRPTGGLQ